MYYVYTLRNIIEKGFKYKPVPIINVFYIARNGDFLA